MASNVANLTWKQSWVAGLVLLGAVMSAWMGFVEVSLQRLENGDILTLLLTAMFVALVIERAVEVFANNRFDPERARIEMDLTIIESKLALHERALAAELGRASVDQNHVNRIRGMITSAQTERESIVGKIEPELASLKRQKAAWAGTFAILLALLAAIVGVRMLGQFLPIEDSMIGGEFGQLLSSADAKIANAARFQLNALRAVDVVLTSALLAGGAEGIHQIIKRFTDLGKT